MKFTKKFFALLLALLMTMSLLATTAMAEGEGEGAGAGSATATVTITIHNASPNHVYEAYQVFGGTLSSDGILSDVKWGTGVNPATLLPALQTSQAFSKVVDGNTVNAFAGSTDAASVATVVSSWGYNDNTVKAFADVVSLHLNSDKKATSAAQSGDRYTITVDAAGYYFIKDVNAVEGTDAATDYLLYVTSSAEISPKNAAPTFAKSVNYEKDNTYHAAIDAQVGDTVYFKLETKLPSLYKDYNQYYMIMQDVLPAGLTFNQVEDIYIAHAAGGTTSSYLGNYTNLNADNLDPEALANPKNYEYDSVSRTLTVNFGDLRNGTQKDPNLNDTYVVKYSATVNDDAVFGKGTYGHGNENTATLYFSNNMNQPADTALDDIQMGSMTASASVYVYQLHVSKVDSQTKALLPNAKFNLYRNMEVGNSTVMYYAVVETQYVKKDERTDTYVAATQDTADHCIYNITHWVAKDDLTGTENINLYSGKDGTFVITGLDYMNYHLKEVQAPDRYNTLADPVLINITSTISGQELTALAGAADGIAGTADVTTGTVSVVVNNTLGNTLPETGGIGTTIFYIVGGVLMLGACAAFVMKKRNAA